MTSAARWSVVLAFAVLTLIGVWVGDPSRQVTTSSFGAIPPAYGAWFELLSSAQLPVGRSYALPEHLPLDTTVWWIEPSGVSHAGPASNPEDEHSDADTFRVGAWAEAGGTAVIFVPHDGSAIGDVVVPARVGVPPAAGESGVAGGRSSAEDDESGEVPPQSQRPRPAAWFTAGHAEEQYLVGRIAPQARTLSASRLVTFAASDGWTVAARLGGQPFVLEQGRGRGRLVLVADAGFLTNAWLDHADNAPFAMDLVREYGVPRFDERQHGLRQADSAVRYIATSAALPLFVGLALLGGLVVWHGRALPPRSVLESSTNSPTLEVFVDSLAALYAGTHDHTHVLAQYRDLTTARLRRHFGLPPQTSSAVLLERLRSTQRGRLESLQCLTEETPVASQAELRIRAQALDALVYEATR